MTTAVAEAFRASLASPDAPADLEWKASPAGSTVATDDQTGVVTAVVAVTGIVDEVDDIILPGAFADTLRARIPKGVWSHDMNTWVARTEEIFEALPGDPRLPKEMKGRAWPAEAGALIVKTRFNLANTDGANAYANVTFFDEGPLGPQVEWSIGYHVPQGKSRRDRLGRRLIASMEAYEYSPVLFGAMPLCGNLATKQRTGRVETKLAGLADAGLQLKAAGSMAKATVHEPVGKGPLWKHKGWQLPAYIQHVANDLRESGHDESRAISMAVGIVKNWAHGHDGKGNKVSATTQAAAEKAIVQWEALKAKAAALRAAKAGKKEAGVELETTGPEVDATKGGPGTKERERAASTGKAMSGKSPGTNRGSYPIRNASELSDAVQAFGRAKNKGAVKRHIIAAARRLGLVSKLPDEWNVTKSLDALDALETDGLLGDDEAAVQTDLADAVAEWLQAITDEGGTPPEIDPADEAITDEGEPGDGEPPAADTDAADAGDAGGEGGEGEVDDEARWLTEIEGLDTGGTPVEVKASKAAGDLSSGDEVTLSVKGQTVTGKVSGTRKRGKIVGVTVDGKTVWVPAAKSVEVKAAVNPYEIEIKEALLAVAEGKDYPYIPGSVEERQGQLSDAVRDLLLPEPDAQGNVRAYASLDATFADYVLATLNDYSDPGGDDDRQSYVIPYTVDDNGDVALGSPTPVKKLVSIIPDDSGGGDDQDDTAGPAGGMNPNLPIARKLAMGTKALVEHLEAKAADGAEVPGVHARELRAAHEGVVNAMAGLGLPTGDVVLDDEPVERKSLLSALDELTLLDADIAVL